MASNHLASATLVALILVSYPFNAATAQNAQSVFTRVSPSVVVIKTKDGQGSGIAVSRLTEGFGKQTLVVTNCHVVQSELLVTVTHRSTTGNGIVKSCDAERDLAIVWVEGELPLVQIRSAATLAVGEAVYAVGAPKGLDLSISEGIVSQLRTKNTSRAPMVQTTAAISPGSSGGGLFDAQGRLVGITTLFLKEAQSLNFAIPSDWIAEASGRGNVRASGVGGLSTPKLAPAPAPAPEPIRPPPTAPSASCGWKKHGRESGTRNASTEYVDACTIRTQGRYRFAWILKAYDQAQTIAAGQYYRSEKHRYAFVCDLARYTIVSGIAYSGAMGAGNVVHSISIDQREWEFEDAVPGSTGEALVNFVCNSPVG